MDMCSNDITSTAATWLINTTGTLAIYIVVIKVGEYYLDACGVSTVPARNFGADVL